MEFKTKKKPRKYYIKRILLGLLITFISLLVILEIYSPIYINGFEDLDSNAEIERVGGDFYENKGDKMYYADYKNNSDQTILFIHGFSASSFSWRKNIQALTSKYHVITLDLLGFGLSKTIASTNINIDRDTEIISQFIQDKKLTNITVVGNSLGGSVAQKLALQNTKDIVSIILINSTDSSDLSSSIFKSIGTFPLIKNPTGFITDKFLISSGVRQAYYDQSLIDKLTIEGYEKGFRYKNSLENMSKFIQSPDPKKEDLSKIQQITIIYSSTDDKVLSPETSKVLSKKILNSTLISIPKVGHLMMEEQPDLINDGIDKWMQEVQLKKNVA